MGKNVKLPGVRVELGLQPLLGGGAQAGDQGNADQILRGKAGLLGQCRVLLHQRAPFFQNRRGHKVVFADVNGFGKQRKVQQPALDLVQQISRRCR